MPVSSGLLSGGLSQLQCVLFVKTSQSLSHCYHTVNCLSSLSRPILCLTSRKTVMSEHIPEEEALCRAHNCNYLVCFMRPKSNPGIDA